MKTRLFVLAGCMFLLAAVAAGQQPAADATMTSEQIPGGVRMHNFRETVEITFCGPDVFHLKATPAGASEPAKPLPQPWIAHPCSPSGVNVTTADGVLHLKSTALDVAIALDDGTMKVLDAAGKQLLQENNRRGFPRRYATSPDAQKPLIEASERFSPDDLEGLYGLGQHQSGVFNYRGAVVELAQANSDIAVPLLLSTNGYGIFWNSAARSMVDNRFERELKLTAAAAEGIDFYFFYGPEMDSIIHHYRQLTGQAPLFAKWAYGFAQSKDRYTSAQQLLDVAASYRSQHVPLDLIVQDWFWWKTQGDPEFAESYLAPHPDVPGALHTLHDEHVHAIISIWAVLDAKSEAYQTLKARNLLVPGTPVYDPSNPAARDFYWNHLASPLAAQGWDGFWLDSSEPETWKGESDAIIEDKQLSIGPGAFYTNAFPLMHTGNVYDHWRQNVDGKRAYILTRSSFAGQQRNATVAWSGDILATYSVLRRQVAAGLNFALSGMPYWTTDIAGYNNTYGLDANQNPAYQELYTRWFEFGTFCPILRTHGHRRVNELFSYGPQTPTLIEYDRLRSRLLPYTYSLAWKVTDEDYTIQRPLVMDWRNEYKVRDIGDEFMFGPALLVAPVLEANATTRPVYLPPAPVWYDFWTGAKVQGDQKISAQAPLSRIPLYARAGAILPLGPPREYASQDPQAPIELRVYTGDDGHFELYEDAGDGYGYEKGEHAVIPMHWKEAAKTLTLGARVGTYPGLVPQQAFHVVWMGGTQGRGNGQSRTAEKTVTYTGAALTVKEP